MIWHAVNKNNWMNNEKIHNFARFQVAHCSYNQHKRILTQVPTAQTKGLIYTYPAVLYQYTQNAQGQIQPTQPRTWLDYGNLFEAAPLNPPETKIQSIEKRIDWVVARGKIAILAVNLAYDDEGYQQRLEAIQYAINRWGSQVRFSEFRQLYDKPARSLVEPSRSINP
ncbi:MAG: hypothetical protein WHS44_12975 [Fimbriimonadales bacterium]